MTPNWSDGSPHVPPPTTGRHTPSEVFGQSRQNSLPSTSCMTMHDSSSRRPPGVARASRRGGAAVRTRPEGGQALVTHEPGPDPHVEVHPVLDDLALGDALEEQARTRPRRGRRRRTPSPGSGGARSKSSQANPSGGGTTYPSTSHQKRATRSGSAQSKVTCTSRTVALMAPTLSVQAELVALGVRHHDVPVVDRRPARSPWLVAPSATSRAARPPARPSVRRPSRSRGRVRPGGPDSWRACPGTCWNRTAGRRRRGRPTPRRRCAAPAGCSRSRAPRPRSGTAAGDGRPVAERLMPEQPEPPGSARRTSPGVAAVMTLCGGRTASSMPPDADRICPLSVTLWAWPTRPPSACCDCWACSSSGRSGPAPSWPSGWA